MNEMIIGNPMRRTLKRLPLVGLEARTDKFNEMYPVGSIVQLKLSQHVKLVILVESPAKVIRRNKGAFIEFNHASANGAYLTNLVTRKIE
jgi:hypothetical protein